MDVDADQKFDFSKKSNFLVADDILRGLPDGLLTANWHSVCLCNSRYQWRGYDEFVGRDTALHIHLPGLTGRIGNLLADAASHSDNEPAHQALHPSRFASLSGRVLFRGFRCNNYGNMEKCPKAQ